MDLCRKTKQEAGRDGDLLRMQSDDRSEWAKLVSGMAQYLVCGAVCCVVVDGCTGILLLHELLSGHSALSTAPSRF
jgi:hypothetical protein